MKYGLLLALVVSISACRTEPAPPNILFIFTDDHSARALSAYDTSLIHTPNLDRIANEGMLFETALVTNSICAPSRATVLTGTYNHINGQIQNGPPFDGSQLTFPKLLQQAGYQTAMIGKWHLKSEPTGFDYWRTLVGQGPYYNPPIAQPGDTTVIEGYTTEVITDIAMNWLTSLRDTEKPFLLMYQHKAPHREWQPGPDYFEMYDGQTFELPETFFDRYENRSSAPAQAAMRIDNNLSVTDLKIDPPDNLTEAQLAMWRAYYDPRNQGLDTLSEAELTQWKYNRYMQDYLRSVKAVDDQVGRVLDYLDASGLAENTIVIYASDQGWYLGEHGWYDKRWMYEPSLKTPFLVRWPGVTTAGTRYDGLVSNVDFAPTMLDAAGVSIPESFQGHSLRTILSSPGASAESVSVRDDFYYHYYEFPGWHCVRRHYGVRTERYKLIYFYGIDEWELFDLQLDPNEVNSVYGALAYAEVEADLKERLARLRAELAVPEDTRPIYGSCEMNGKPIFTQEDV